MERAKKRERKHRNRVRARDVEGGRGRESVRDLTTEKNAIQYFSRPFTLSIPN